MTRWSILQGGGLWGKAAIFIGNRELDCTWTGSGKVKSSKPRNGHCFPPGSQAPEELFLGTGNWSLRFTGNQEQMPQPKFHFHSPIGRDCHSPPMCGMAFFLLPPKESGSECTTLQATANGFLLYNDISDFCFRKQVQPGCPTVI